MNFNYKQRITTKIANKPIDKLLDNIRMESVFFIKSNLTKPWAIDVPSMKNCMMFHLSLSGDIELRVNNNELLLKEGDFILLPNSIGHIVSDGNYEHATPLHKLPIKLVTERYETLSYGGGGTCTHLVCGAFIFEHPISIKLFQMLPPFIIINKSKECSSKLVNKISEILNAETQQISVGSEAIIARLADILVISAIKQHLLDLDNDKIGWIGAIHDNRIEKALRIIHNQPSKHWVLEDLALEVGMSRTSFATQFKELVGNTPMDYLAEWRMSIAYSKLQLTKDSLLTIALDVGYHSEASFSRAFKKVIGKSPREVRKSYYNF